MSERVVCGGGGGGAGIAGIGWERGVGGSCRIRRKSGVGERSGIAGRSRIGGGIGRIEGDGEIGEEGFCFFARSFACYCCWYP